MRRVHLRLSARDVADLDSIGFAEGFSRAELVRAIIRVFLEEMRDGEVSSNVDMYHGSDGGREDIRSMCVVS